MLLILPLRREAEAEAVRIHEARARTRDDAAITPGDISVIALRTSSTRGLDTPGVIFFVRAGTSDAAGRLLEHIVVAVRMPLTEAPRGRRRRDIRAQAQNLYDRCASDAIAVARERITRRADTIALEYGQGLERASRREQQLAELVAGGSHPLTQTGLFDRRELKHRDSVRLRQAMAAADSSSRVESLHSALLTVSAQSPEIVLLLIINRRA